MIAIPDFSRNVPAMDVTTGEPVVYPDGENKGEICYNQCTTPHHLDQLLVMDCSLFENSTVSEPLTRSAFVDDILSGENMDPTQSAERSDQQNEVVGKEEDVNAEAETRRKRSASGSSSSGKCQNILSYKSSKVFQLCTRTSTGLFFGHFSGM